MSAPTASGRRSEQDVETPAEPLAAVRPWTIAVGFGLVAVVVCAAGSWIPSLWGDEATTLLSAQRPVGSLLEMLTHVDAVHGLYYLLMHGWIRLAGDSAFALRFPSAVAVGLAVAGMTLLAGRRGGPTAAVVAGVVGCVLPRLSYAGEEARSFALTAAAAVWLTLLLVWLVDGRGRTVQAGVRRACWALYGVGLALTSVLFLYFSTLALAHLALLVATRTPRRTVRTWAVAAGAAIVSLLPLAVLAFLERSQIGYLGSEPSDPFGALYTPWFSTPWIAVVAWALIGLACGSAVRTWRRSGRGPLPFTTTWVALAWLVVPTGAMLLLNLLYPMWTARYSTFAAPAAALLVADGLLVLGRAAAGRWRLPVLAATGAAVVAFVAVCTPTYLLQRGPYAKNDSDWAEVSAAMGVHAQPGDAVVFDEATKPSQRPRLAMHTYPDGFASVADVTLRTPYTRSHGWADTAYSVPTAAALGRFDGVRRVWLVENDIDGALSSYGRADLEAIGFEETGLTVQTHRTLLIELTR
ncbi:MAG: glycosyltransferase family 39 protein [Leifsonia sp.]|uniref:glycosyltransferase family 39 protein n=1 Tax=Leifsonia sp. TaxID=1870902 RepID=UPI003F7F18D8